MQLQTVHKSRSRKPAPRFLMWLLISNFLTAGGVYLYESHQFSNRCSQADQQIQMQGAALRRLEQVNVQIKTDYDRLATHLKDNQKAMAETGKLAPNNVWIGKIKPGNVVAGLTAKTVEVFDKNGALSTGNAHVEFEGRLTLTGRFTYYDTAPIASLGGMVVFSDLDESSKAKVPQIFRMNRTFFLVFKNQNLAQELLGPRGSTGYVTILVDAYEINLSKAHDVWDTAELIKVIEKI